MPGVASLVATGRCGAWQTGGPAGRAPLPPCPCPLAGTSGSETNRWLVRSCRRFGSEDRVRWPLGRGGASGAKCLPEAAVFEAHHVSEAWLGEVVGRKGQALGLDAV